jgi:hydrogenase small subunit
MILTRRDFLNLCTSSAAVLGLSASDILHLQELFAGTNAPTVLWLQGSGCTGCSVSFLNYVSSTAPRTPADILINNVNLAYHPTVMAASGQSAVNAAQAAYNKGGYVLVVEGGVPTAFGGNTCIAWTSNGTHVTFKDAVTSLAAKASKVLCIGTCASYGGVSAAAPNLSAVKSVKSIIGKSTFNIPGCPPHPNWIVWAIVKILTKASVRFDSYGRPTDLYSTTVHDRCPRREKEETHTYGQDLRCLEELGCRGPKTRANCPVQRWNNGANWCVDANSQCIGCTEPWFPNSTLRSSAGEGDD